MPNSLRESRVMTDCIDDFAGICNFTWHITVPFLISETFPIIWFLAPYFMIYLLLFLVKQKANTVFGSIGFKSSVMILSFPNTGNNTFSSAAFSSTVHISKDLEYSGSESCYVNELLN